MNVSELGRRYAKALYELAVDSGKAEKILNDLRCLKQAIEGSEEIGRFLTNPLTPPNQVRECFEKVFAKTAFEQQTQQLILLLIEKSRLPVFVALASAFEQECDLANQVCRGTVRSASELGPTDRNKVETTVERVLKKKVILTYRTDPSLLGGLVAQVGSYTFDDSLSSHLNRLRDDLKRRAV